MASSYIFIKNHSSAERLLYQCSVAKFLHGTSPPCNTKSTQKRIFIMYNAAFVVPPHILLSLHFEHFVDSSTEKDKASYMCLPQKMWLSVSMLLPWPLPSTDFSHTTKAPRNPIASVWKSNREWWPNNQQAAALYMVLPCKHPMGGWQNCNSKSLHLKIYYFLKLYK